MSRPRIPGKFNPSKSAEPPRDYSLRPTKRPHQRSARDAPVGYFANGQAFTQDDKLPTKPGQVGLQDPPLHDIPSIANHTSAPAAPKLNEREEATLSWNETAEHWTPHLNKRKKQSQRWTAEVIPRLIPPYMTLLRETDKLHLDPEPTYWPCSCGGRGFRLLNIVVVRFSRLSEISLEVCECTSAGEQLVQMGLFPCAPCYPTLAVDIRVLNFVAGLFLRVAPNHRAWCDTVTEFLDCQGYRMKGQDPLRRRFSNALQWYTSLRLATKGVIDKMLLESREVLRSPPDNESFHVYERDTSPSPRSSRPSSPADVHEEPPESSPPSSRPSSPFFDDSVEGSSRSPTPEYDTHKRPRLEDTRRVLTRPSDYLRLRCPTCYGGWDSSRRNELDFDAIVCLDACFTQKHNKSRARDPMKQHPDSAFLEEAELEAAEVYVETLRPSRTKSKQGSDSSDPELEREEEEDGYEGAMKVPRSALRGCNESFTAADERRQKASTQFFDCTGLMALLCRHDRVLWIANMTSAGEKQFYVIALLRKLFEHLPEDFEVGLLYDIGCQLDHSCDKWGFLEEFRDRLAFAISVFHAFGHHWACQLVYHPRKRKGFGFSDGEGCERFWHSISRLIPYLRVCGYYQRIFTLDAQVQHADQESLKGLGDWLARKYSDARGAQLEGEREMRASGRSEEFLREQWEEQVADQTKPLPSQLFLTAIVSFLVLNSAEHSEKSNQLGKKAVQEVLRIRTSVELLEKKSRQLESVAMDLDADDLHHQQAVDELPEIQRKLTEGRKKLKAKERLLGVQDAQAVRHLQNSPFLRERMKALALKTRLVALLRARKFQRDRLERSFRKQTNEAKLHSQISQSVKRKDPGIQKVARDYNGIVKKLKEMIRRRTCPRHATAPRDIPMDKLFTLDVDDEIWEDVGLTDEWDRPDLPPWLVDEDVRTGIRAMLQHDRAKEELARLKVERDAMQWWFAEEWAVVLHALDETTHPDLRFQLLQRREELLSLCATWQGRLAHLPSSPNVPEWGPTKQEISDAKSNMAAKALETKQKSPGESCELGAGLEVEDEDESEDDAQGEEYDEDDLNTLETFNIVDDNETGEDLL
ncbi:hypothetical protein V5O48_010382 [Marasmius crinis-equi]|uniref:CxC1-like cysteine cluster associated with KDZ transposases domain-containing protein n=1 Tax=Marasmius crinis-equi TaxID=585013 RepID=A0ABR3F8F8_9AGAR